MMTTQAIATAGGGRVRAPRQRRRSGGIEGQRRRIFWPFAAPALLVYAILFIAPTFVGVYASFTRWRGSGDEMTWIGIDNFVRLASDGVFQQAFWNTLTIVIVCGVFIFLFAFIITVLLREMRAKNALRSILFVPYIVSPIVVGVALGLFLAPTGALNSILRGVGLGFLTQEWLSPDNLFRTILVGIIWVTSGFYVLLLTTGVDQIPAYFYEDATLSGVTQWQKFRYVTLPLSWDVVSVAAVLWVINSVRIFEFVYAFVGTASAPPVSARTVSIQQFLMTTGGRNPAYEMGYGSAMGVFMIILIGVLVVVVRRLMKRERLEF